MRGTDGTQESLFTMAKLEDFVPADHPLRPIRVLVNEALERLNGRFNAIYADMGRASIAPEKLMRALLLQVFYTVRSERQICEQLRYNLLFRWFVGWRSTMRYGITRYSPRTGIGFSSMLWWRPSSPKIMRLADAKGLLSKEHFFSRRHADPGMGEPQEFPAQGRN